MSVDKKAKVVATPADRAEATFQQAYFAHQKGMVSQAQAGYRRAIEIRPDHVPAWHLLGVSHAQLGNFTEAVGAIARAVQLHPADYAMYNNLANALIKLERFEEALNALGSALKLQPGSAQVWNNRGNALYGLERMTEAIQSYNEALRLNPQYAEALCNKANALLKLGLFSEAMSCAAQALLVDANSVTAHDIKGRCLTMLNQNVLAVQSFDNALALRPNFAQAWFGKGLSCIFLNQTEVAVQALQRALELDPKFYKAYPELAAALFRANRFDEALLTLDKAIAFGVKKQNILGARTLIKTQICDWEGLAEQLQVLFASVRNREQSTQPFHLLSVTDDLQLHRLAAETYLGSRCLVNQEVLPPPRIAGAERIKLGYFSADFFHHATLRLMAEFFELHDKAKFEVTAFSFSPPVDDPYKTRLIAAIDRFVDVNEMSDTDVAVLSRQLGIDIAIDLKGLTSGCRPGIFAARAAPIQVSYLGYPGTMGVPFIDYILADNVLIPDELRVQYSEKVVQLPHTYQVNDRKRQPLSKSPDRASVGLPDTGFVYCCFNNSYKITSDVFAIWMRVLRRVPASVLWVFADNPRVEANLAQAARAHGVQAERLVFARRVGYEENQSRQQLADLMLDTFPYNAHTTASDALWAGLPILTRQGQSFAARVASSLLHAAGLPEMVTTTEQAYEEAAVMLGNKPKAMSAIKSKLRRAKAAAPLFDIPLLTRDIERAYQAMYDRYLQNLEPDHLKID